MFITTNRYLGKVSIVTGAGSGIGRAIVERIVAEGGLVVANDLREENLGSVDGLERVVTVVGDIGDPTTSDQLVTSALDVGGGRIDAVFNNAGVVTYQPAVTYSMDDWDLNLRINLTAYFLLSRRAAEVMIPQRSGAILNVSSGAGIHGVPDNVAYVAAKHATVGVTRALAVEWGRYNIRVNALCPGFTESALLAESKRQAPERFLERAQRTPLLRSAQPEEQAAMAVFLNSDESTYTTGLIAVVDGGVHALSAGYKAPQRED